MKYITRNFDTCNKTAKTQSCIVDVVTKLRAGRSAVRILVVVRKLYILQKGHGAHQSSRSVGTGVLCRDKASGACT